MVSLPTARVARLPDAHASSVGDGVGASDGATLATLGAMLGAWDGAADGEAPPLEQAAATAATRARAVMPFTMRMGGVLLLKVPGRSVLVGAGRAGSRLSGGQSPGLAERGRRPAAHAVRNGRSDAGRRAASLRTAGSTEGG